MVNTAILNSNDIVAAGGASLDSQGQYAEGALAVDATDVWILSGAVQ